MRRTTTITDARTPRRAEHRELRVALGRDGTIVVVGDLDAASSAALDHAFEQVERDAPASIVLDLGGVEFMDSSGLRSIVAASLRARRRDQRVTLRNVGPELTRLLEITGLHGQFDLPASDRT